MSIYFLNYHNSQYYYILINYKYEYYLSQKSMAGCFERTVMADNRESDRMNLDVDWQHNWIGGFRIEPEIRDGGRSENLEGLGLLKAKVLLLFRQKSEWGGGAQLPLLPPGLRRTLRSAPTKGGEQFAVQTFEPAKWAMTMFRNLIARWHFYVSIEKFQFTFPPLANTT